MLQSNGSKTLFHSGLTLPSSMVFGFDILYITDSEQKKVIGLDVSGNVVADFTFDTFVFPTGIAFDPINKYILVSFLRPVLLANVLFRRLTMGVH